MAEFLPMTIPDNITEKTLWIIEQNEISLWEMVPVDIG